MPRWYTGNDTARRAYYDRDPIPIFALYSTVVAPHPTTLRASYSPPYGYAAFIESVYMALLRYVAATTPNFVQDTFNMVPYYGGSFNVYVQFGYFLTQGVQEKTQFGSYGYLAYGDTLNFYTQDNSIGGSMYHHIAMKGTEFEY